MRINNYCEAPQTHYIMQGITAALIAATGKINDAMSGNNLNLLDKKQDR